MGMRIVTSFRIVIALILPCSYFTQENICSTTSGEKVVHVCEGNFATGTSVYLDTFKAVNYEGGCTCQLRAQGGAVDLQVSVQGVHAACDATLYFAPPIDHTYNCADKTPATTTGRIESGQSVFLSLTKSSDVADFCVHLVQTSTAGSLNVACTKGTLKPASTTTIAPAPAVTTSPTTIIENACLSESGDKVVHVCEKSFGTGTSIYLDTARAVNYQGRCLCQLRAQGAAVDLQVSVQGGVHTDCDATLYFSPSIDHTYNCADKTPSPATGRIESGQMVFLTLTKTSDVADFCIHLVPTSAGGSLNVACTQGTLKPASTTTLTPIPVTTPTPKATLSPTTIIENACRSDPGDKVVHMCEGNFETGTSIYLDTAKAVNYQGRCVCQLRAQGAAVDIQVSVQGGVHTDCDATLYFSPSIDHTYNCADKTPSPATGRIESGQMVFLTLTKTSDVADFCVHVVQTSSGAGSLNLACSSGTLKSTSPPATTSSPTNAPNNVATTLTTSVTQSKGSSSVSPDNTVTESKGSSSESPENTVTESKGSSSESPDNTVTESKGSSTEKPDNTVTESKGSSSESPDNTVTESKGSSSESPENTVTESKGSSSEKPDNTVTESKGSSSEKPDNTVTESKGSSSESPDNTVTESKGSSGENPDNTVTESKDSSSENPDNTVTESKGSSTESPNITPSGNTGLNTAETPQSVIVVSFVVVGVFAAIVVVMILFGIFTYCRDKSRLGKLRAAQNLPNGHTNV